MLNGSPLFTGGAGSGESEIRKWIIENDWLPHVPDAWIDHDKTKVGYEIPFNRHFYQYVPPRPLAEIDAELKALSTEIMGLLQEVVA